MVYTVYKPDSILCLFTFYTASQLFWNQGCTWPFRTFSYCIHTDYFVSWSGKKNHVLLCLLVLLSCSLLSCWWLTKHFDDLRIDQWMLPKLLWKWFYIQINDTWCQPCTYRGLFKVQDGGQRVSTAGPRGEKPRSSRERHGGVDGHLLVHKQLLQRRKTLTQHRRCRTQSTTLLNNEVCNRKKSQFNVCVTL